MPPARRTASRHGSVLVCELTESQSATIRRAVGKSTTLQPFADFKTASAFLHAQSTSISAVIVGAAASNNTHAIEFVACVAKNFFGIPILACCDLNVACSPTIRALVLAGVHELVFTDEDDKGFGVRAALESAAYECAVNVVRAHLTSVIPPSLHRFVDAALAAHDPGVSASSIARVLHVNRKTLTEACTAGHLPPPSELLVWCRIALATHLLSCNGRTIQSVAAKLAFPSALVLRSRIKTYAGVESTQVSTGRGAELVARRLRHRIAHLDREQTTKA